MTISTRRAARAAFDSWVSQNAFQSKAFQSKAFQPKVLQQRLLQLTRNELASVWIPMMFRTGRALTGVSLLLSGLFLASWAQAESPAAPVASIVESVPKAELKQVESRNSELEKVELGKIELNKLEQGKIEVSSMAMERTAAARLLGLVLDTYIPAVLHEEKDVPWLGGKRSIKITKAGTATLTSDAQAIVVTFPLAAKLWGDIDTNVLLMNVKAACVADFVAPAKIAIQVNFASKPLDLEVRVDVATPPVLADCEGFKLSVETVIAAVIDQQKPKWQQDIEQQLSDGLMILGL
jgi:hypothetical protein